jgi:ribosomal protein S18 acetylase RimI-like enzyme
MCGSKDEPVTAPSRQSTNNDGNEIRILTPADVRSLRLPWDGRFSVSELEAVAEIEPRLSVWSERTGEYLIGGPWRHRHEISTIHELAASASAVELIHAFARVCQRAGVEMIVASEQSERRKRQFYDSALLDPIEEIIVYELARLRPQPPATGELRFEPFQVSDDEAFHELLHLDHQSFPWMWWNSREEFIEYAGSPGVAIEVGRDRSGRMLAYVGITRYRSWGHLDRIAVAPDAQGRGYGRAALDYAIMTLARAGARRIGLSTQAQNVRSRRLYEAYGFRRSPSHDYHLYGRMLPVDEKTIQKD